MKRSLFTAALALLLLPIALPTSHAASVSAGEGLLKHGAIDPSSGFPLWYEDKNGFKLSVCDNPNNCFLAIDPALPLQFPFDNPTSPNNNFADEIFYFVADSLMTTGGNITAGIELAVEGAFANEVVMGDQLVFSRVRIRIGGLTEGASYRVTYPYGVHEFIAGPDAGPGTAPGSGISMVRDIGTIPGAFEAVLSGDIGPFLIPTGYLPGDQFLTTGFVRTAVTGSPLGTNYFRIEGPGVGLVFANYRCADPALGPDPIGIDDCVENDQFMLHGKITDLVGSKIDRVSYSKTATDTYVNVWVTSDTSQMIVASVDGTAGTSMVEESPGVYFTRIPLGTLGPLVKPHEVMVTNFSDSPATSFSVPVTDHITINVADNNVRGSTPEVPGLSISVQSSNRVDPVSVSASMLMGAEFNPVGIIPDGIVLTDLGGGLAEGSYPTSGAVVTGEAPPLTLLVESSHGGRATSGVSVSGIHTSGAPINGVRANAGQDFNLLVGNTVVSLNGGHSIGPGPMSYEWTHDAPLSAGITISSLNMPQLTVGVPPTLPASMNGKIIVNFTLTVSDTANPLLTDTDVAIITITEPQALPVDTCSIIESLYRPDKERWVVSGNCDLVDNQNIKVYAGDASGPNLSAFIGESWVDAAGSWLVSPGNGTAPLGTLQAGTLADEITPTYAYVYAISERGSVVRSAYTIE